MNVLIYGGGSVGLGIASCLIPEGAHVMIVARENTVARLRKDGLVRTGIFGNVRAKPGDFCAYSSLDEFAGAACDYVLVCTKSYDSQAAAQDLCRHSLCVNESTAIVLFQNGWGNAEIFASVFPKDQIFNARVITGFTRPVANEVIITVHADAIHVGSLFGGDPGRVEDLCRAIANGGIPCVSTREIEKDLWAKMLYNCALNPLGAVLNLTYGELAKDQSARVMMDHVIEEIFNVMNAAGFRTHWQRPADFLDVFYNKLVPDTALHKSSTLQDIMAGKKTEIDALNGAVIALAREHHIPVPWNKQMYDKIKELERAKR